MVPFEYWRGAGGSRLMDPNLKAERSTGTLFGQGKRRTGILEAPARRAVRCKKSLALAIGVSGDYGSASGWRSGENPGFFVNRRPPGVCPALSLLVFGPARA